MLNKARKAEQKSTFVPDCHYKLCVNADAMTPGMGILAQFWAKVWRAEHAPKEMLLKMVDGDNPEFCSLMIMADQELLIHREKTKNS